MNALKKLSGIEKIKDFGNITGSNENDNSIDEEIDNILNYRYTSKIKLPLDLYDEDKIKTNLSNSNKNGIDLSILTKVLLPQKDIFKGDENTIWTFDSVLKELQETFNNERSN